MDKLWAMRVFVRVMECGGFSRAAESLNLANATVTSSVKNLEQHLGVTLIQRNTRHLRLTEEGELFFLKSKEIIESVAQVELEVRGQASEVSGVLKVESPFAIGQSLLGPLLPEFSRRYPDLSVALNLTNDPRNLIERRTDVAIRMDGVEDADLVARPIYEANYMVYGAPLLVDAVQAINPKDLDPSLCLGLFKDNYQTPNHWFFARGEEKVVIEPKGKFNSNNTGALINAAKQGVGFIYILDIFAEEELRRETLKPLFLDWQTSIKIFHAVTVKSRFSSPKTRAFVDFLLEIFDDERRPSIREQVKIDSWKGRRRTG
jgi:LysR family transcriptional regulator for bpeEF and oprC